MASFALVSWNAPTHIHTEKRRDWYWIVGIISAAIAITCFLFGELIVGIFVVVAAMALMIHASQPAQVIRYQINDRGIVQDDVLYPFVNLESFWIPHNDSPRILIKTRQFFMPLMVIHIDEVDPERVRNILLRYIAETEHQEPFLKKLLDSLGF